MCWGALFRQSDLVAGETTLAGFHIVLQSMLEKIQTGGPGGFALTDKESLWMIWVVLEDAQERLLGIQPKPDFILPQAKGMDEGCVFRIRTSGLEMIQDAEQKIDALFSVEATDKLLKATWAEPLTKEEEAEIDRAFIVAHYPKLLGVAIAKGPENPA